MTTKHTPGPWRIGDAGSTVFGPKTERPSPVSVCTISGPTPRLPPEEKQANARLIAAAPDMLEALEAMAAELSDGGGDRSYAAWEAAKAKALAAIAKARGKA